MPVGAAGRCCGRTNRDPYRPSARSLLIRVVGGAALGKGRCYPRPDEPKSASPTGSGVPGSVEFRWARLLCGEVSEVHHRHHLQSTGVELAPSSRLCLAVLECGLRPGGRSTRRASRSSPGGEAAEGEQAPAPSSGRAARTRSRETWHRTCTKPCSEPAPRRRGSQDPRSTRPALPWLPGGGPKNRTPGSGDTSATTQSVSRLPRGDGNRGRPDRTPLWLPAGRDV
jgi:hypothetical protein